MNQFSEDKIITPVADKSTVYQADDEYEKSLTKRMQRDRIYSFVEQNYDVVDVHGGRVNPRYAGLPGKYWLFEARLQSDFKNMQFIGFEKDHKTFIKSASNMPRLKAYHPYIHMKEKVFKGLEIEWFKTSLGLYIHGDIETFTEDSTHEIITTARKSLKNGLTNRNLIWYDFTAPFNKETYCSIYNIKNIVNRERKVLVCLTLMYGRDEIYNGKGDEARIDIVRRALPGFKPVDYWLYSGMNGTPMINICGILPASVDDV